MVKLKQLKRKLLIEMGITTAVIVVTGGILYYLSSLTDNYRGSIQTLEGQVNEIASTTSALRTKYNEARNNTLYQEAMKRNGGDGLYINRELVKDGFNAFKSRFHLDNLHLSMSPVGPMKDAKFKRNTHETVFSDVDVGFETLSDEFVYSLMEALDKDLPGTSKITKLTLTREGKVDEAALQTIRTKGSIVLVRGDIKFLWFGIKPIEPANGTSADAAKP